MKELHGKFCQRCRGQALTIAATGAILVARCVSCGFLNVMCPEPACSGKMNDVPRRDSVEMECNRCAYTTTFVSEEIPVERQHALFI